MSDNWMGQIAGGLEAAGKGAAAGAVLGPIGAAAGGAIGLAMNLLPGAAHLLGGDDETAAKVVQTVRAVTGSSDPAQQAVAIADPQIEADLRVQLAQIAADRQQAILSDVQDARKQTVDLAQANSKIAWSAPIISIVVLLSFAVMTGVVVTRSLPQGSEQIALVMLGTLGTLATSVVSYWVGSSAGSAQKSDLLANTVPAHVLDKPLETQKPK